MAWALDRSTTPWTLHFDNGMDLQLSEYPTTATIYGYGYAPDFSITQVSGYPVVDLIIKTARGTTSIENYKALTSDGDFDYFSNKYILTSPLNDSSKLDFTNASFGQAPGDYHRAWVFIKMMYEMGIWSKVDVIALGAVETSTPVKYVDVKYVKPPIPPTPQ